MSYNGHKNYETWNVSLWISNDEGLYEMARRCRDYAEFQRRISALDGSIAYQTPDNVCWNDSGLDIKALNEMITGL